MVREVCEHSGKTFKQYQLFYLQNKQMLPAITVTWQRQTLSIVGVAAHHVCPQTIFTLSPSATTKAMNVKHWSWSGWRWSSGCWCCRWAVLPNRAACLLTSSLLMKLFFSPLSFESLSFSLTFLLLILRWILEHSMTVNVAVSDCTEWDDSILATHWKAI